MCFKIVILRQYSGPHKFLLQNLNEIQKILSKEGFPEEVVNSTASFVSKNIGKEGYKQKIYRGIIKENGQKQGLAIYRLIKDKVK